MLTLNFDPFPVITAERLLLRKVNMKDVNEIFFLRSDERVMKFIDRTPAKSVEEASDFVKNILTLEENNEAVTWAITLNGKTKLIGTICYWSIQKAHFRAEVGYVLHPEFWGKGIMQEALEEIIKFGFNSMNLHSIEANVNPGNEASIKLLERNNFRREAFFREKYFFDGKFLDTAIYSLLASEFKKS